MKIGTSFQLCGSMLDQDEVGINSTSSSETDSRIEVIDKCPGFIWCLIDQLASISWGTRFAELAAENLIVSILCDFITYVVIAP